MSSQGVHLPLILFDSHSLQISPDGGFREVDWKSSVGQVEQFAQKCHESCPLRLRYSCANDTAIRFRILCVGRVAVAVTTAVTAAMVAASSKLNRYFAVKKPATNPATTGIITYRIGSRINYLLPAQGRGRKRREL
jgi:hypothetical protein